MWPSSACASLRRPKALPEIPHPQIFTLTINPAVDVSTSVKKMLPFTKMHCRPAHRDAGGGGINVARVLRRLGTEVTAVYPAAGSTGHSLNELIDAEGVHSIVVPTRSDTRENLTIFDEASGEQFRLIFPGAPLIQSEWQECIEAIKSIGHRAAFVIASGSLSPGVPDDFYRTVVQTTRGSRKVVVDTSGAALKAAVEAGLYLIKPNLHEFQELAGITTNDKNSLIEAGRQLLDRYQIEIIALSLGSDGALLLTRDAIWSANGLPIRPVSVSGAGDSFLGAIIWSLANRSDLDTALRYGVAAGSAALLNPGTELCRAADVHRLAAEVTVTKIAKSNA